MTTTIPLFNTEPWGTATPSGTTLTNWVSSSNHDGIAFKFTMTSQGISGIILNWAKSGGTPRCDIGIETLTAGVPSTAAAYVGGLFKTNVVPTATGSSVPEFIEFLGGEIGSPTPGTAYALTIRIVNPGGNTITVTALGAGQSGANTRGSVAAFTKVGSGAFTSSASRWLCPLVYDAPFDGGSQVDDDSFVHRGTYGIASTNIRTLLSASNPNEYGNKWLQQQSAVMSAVQFWGQVGSLTTTTFNVKLYEDDVAVITQAVSGGAFRASGTYNVHIVPLLMSYRLKAGKTYRLTVTATHASGSVSLDELIFFADTSGAGGATPNTLRELAVGAGHRCSYSGGSWSDSTSAAMTITPLLNASLSDAPSGSGFFTAAEG